MNECTCKIYDEIFRKIKCLYKLVNACLVITTLLLARLTLKLANKARNLSIKLLKKLAKNDEITKEITTFEKTLKTLLIRCSLSHMTKYKLRFICFVKHLASHCINYVEQILFQSINIIYNCRIIYETTVNTYIIHEHYNSNYLIATLIILNIYRIIHHIKILIRITINYQYLRLFRNKKQILKSKENESGEINLSRKFQITQTSIFKSFTFLIITTLINSFIGYTQDKISLEETSQLNIVSELNSFKIYISSLLFISTILSLLRSEIRLCVGSTKTASYNFLKVILESNNEQLNNNSYVKNRSEKSPYTSDTDKLIIITDKLSDHTDKGRYNKIECCSIKNKKIETRNMILRKRYNEVKKTNKTVNSESTQVTTEEVKTTAANLEEETKRRKRGRTKSDNILETIEMVVRRGEENKTPENINKTRNNKETQLTPRKNHTSKRAKIQACETINELKAKTTKKKNLAALNSTTSEECRDNDKKIKMNIIRIIYDKIISQKVDVSMSDEPAIDTQITSEQLVKMLDHPAVTNDKKNQVELVLNKLNGNVILSETEKSDTISKIVEFNEYCKITTKQEATLEEAMNNFKDMAMVERASTLLNMLKTTGKLVDKNEIESIRIKLTKTKEYATICEKIQSMIQDESFKESKLVAPYIIKINNKIDLNEEEINIYNSVKSKYEMRNYKEALIWMLQELKLEWNMSAEYVETVTRLRSKIEADDILEDHERDELDDIILQFTENYESEEDEFDWDSDESQLNSSPRTKRLNSVDKEEKEKLIAEHYSKIKRVLEDNEELDKMHPREMYIVYIEGKCLSTIDNDFEERKKKIFEYKKVAEPESCELLRINKEELVGKFKDQYIGEDIDSKKRMIRIKVDNYDDFTKLLTPWSNEIFGGEVIATMAPVQQLKIQFEVETDYDIENIKDALEEKYGIYNIKRIYKKVVNRYKKAQDESETLEIPTRIITGEALTLYHYINSIKNKIYVNQTKRVVKFMVDHARCCGSCPSITHSHCNNDHEFCHRCGQSGHRMAKCTNEIRCARCFRAHYCSSEECKQIRELTYKKNDYIIGVLLANKIIRNKSEILDLKFASDSTRKEIDAEANLNLYNNIELSKLKDEISQELSEIRVSIEENKARLDKQDNTNIQLKDEMLKISSSYNELKTVMSSRCQKLEDELAGVKRTISELNSKIDTTKIEIIHKQEESLEKTTKNITETITLLFAKQAHELRGNKDDLRGKQISKCLNNNRKK